MSKQSRLSTDTSLHDFPLLFFFGRLSVQFMDQRHNRRIWIAEVGANIGHEGRETVFPQHSVFLLFRIVAPLPESRFAAYRKLQNIGSAFSFAIITAELAAPSA
jgi:hypothetical protein